jgi:hypothetical protein
MCVKPCYHILWHGTWVMTCQYTWHHHIIDVLTTFQLNYFLEKKFTSEVTLFNDQDHSASIDLVNISTYLIGLVIHMEFFWKKYNHIIQTKLKMTRSWNLSVKKQLFLLMLVVLQILFYPPMSHLKFCMFVILGQCPLCQRL